ncbi:unnamed protein product, partial [Ectocarpus sp. 12 AP-2014]
RWQARSAVAGLALLLPLLSSCRRANLYENSDKVRTALQPSALGPRPPRSSYNREVPPHHTNRTELAVWDSTTSAPHSGFQPSVMSLRELLGLNDAEPRPQQTCAPPATGLNLQRSLVPAGAAATGPARSRSSSSSRESGDTARRLNTGASWREEEQRRIQRMDPGGRGGGGAGQVPDG